jgi:hypothetical protein
MEDGREMGQKGDRVALNFLKPKECVRIAKE